MTEERPIFLSDVIDFFVSKRKKVGVAVLCSFCLTLILIAAFHEPHYRAEASFQQSQHATEDLISIESVLKSMKGYSSESSAQVMMQSRTLLRNVVEKLGLQMVSRKSEVSRMRISHVSYRGEEEKVLQITPLSEKEFSIAKHNKQAHVGERVEVDGACFVVEHLDYPAKTETYRLLPMRKAVSKLKKSLTIKPSRVDSNVLQLRAKHPHRDKAIAILDCLMDQFQRYLQNEHEELSNEQIVYLQKRQNQLGEEFDRALDAHVSYLENALGVEGFLGLSQEIEALSQPREKYISKRHQLDLEKKQWRESELQASQAHPWKEGAMQHHELEWKLAQIEPGDGIYEGITLETASELYTQHCMERDKALLESDHLHAILEKLEEPAFDFSSLSTYIVDPVSQKRIEKGAEIASQLSQTKSYTSLERQRLREELDRQRTLLKTSLEEQIRLCQMKQEVIEDKMHRLRHAALQLIEKEKNLIDAKLAELTEKMKELPDKWKLESKLKMRKELIMQIIEGLTQLAETKLADHHLFQIESKPIDRADAPPKRQNPHYILFSSLGGVLGGFFFFTLAFAKALYQGLPISRNYLRYMGYSSFPSDTATLAKVAATIREHETIALIGKACAADLEALVEVPCTFLETEEGISSASALRFLRRADRFILFLKSEKVENLHPYAKEKTQCVLIE